MLSRIISGGQTGVDRGALDAALAAGFACGGSCPLGRKAEDGRIPDRYPVVELMAAGYRERTRRNVLDSDGTLVICFGQLSGGTLETVRFAERFGKPHLVVDGAVTGVPEAAKAVQGFIATHSIRVLNVAGPRESTHAGAQAYSAELIARVLQNTVSLP